MKRLLLILLALAYSPSALATFKVYIAPAGQCASYNSGTNSNAPVCTLSQAQAILKSHLPTTNVEVHITAGTYYGQTVVWDFIPKSGNTIYTTTFTPKNFGNGWAHFHGQGNKDQFFELRYSGGTASNVTFRRLKVTHYTNGIKVAGNWADETKWNSHNTFDTLYFSNMGSNFSSPGEGYSDILLLNSRYNTVKDCQFYYAENPPADASKMHGVYLSHYSSHNTVRDNVFENVSGSGIKLRHEANDNLIEDNSFNLVGNGNISAARQIGDWPCVPSLGDTCTVPQGISDECPSARNTIRNNAKGADDATTTQYIPLFLARSDGQETSICSSWTGPRATVTGTTHIPIVRGETVTIEKYNNVGFIDPYITVLPNDFDGDGDTLSLASVHSDLGDAQAVVSGNTVQVTSASLGNHRLRYYVQDPDGNKDYAYINLTVIPYDLRQ